MIAKTSLGSNFSGALNYGAGISLKGVVMEGKSELLTSYNLVSDRPSEMAKEMEAVASYSKCEKPVWHTSLSWPPEEKVTNEQMTKAAELYCNKIGADLNKHQVVVFRHNDQKHDHIHIYINRVADGKAIETSHNYAQNVRVCKEISEELGFKNIPKLKQDKPRKVLDFQKEAQQVVGNAIKKELKKKCNSLEDLEKSLVSQGIECRFTSVEGKLKASSYKYDGVSIKGQDVGFTSKKLEEALSKNKEIEKTMGNSFGISI